MVLAIKYKLKQGASQLGDEYIYSAQVDLLSLIRQLMRHSGRHSDASTPTVRGRPEKSAHSRLAIVPPVISPLTQFVSPGTQPDQSQLSAELPARSRSGPTPGGLAW